MKELREKHRYPWRVSNKGVRDAYHIIDQDDKPFAVVCADELGNNSQTALERANMMAEAPELYICLTAILKITCGDCKGETKGDCRADDLACALSAQARAALAKAEGKA